MAKRRKNIKPDKRRVVKPTAKKTAKKKGVGTKASKKKLSTKKKTSKKNVKPVKKGAGFSSNNFNSIRSLIWQAYGLDYTSYFDPEFIRVVRAVYNECKSFGQECTEQDIWRIYDDVTEDPKRPFPYIAEDLYEAARQYYEILNVEFTVFPAYLWIKSPMIIPPPSEFITTNYYSKDGSTDKGYRKYFKEFVDWANQAEKIKRRSIGSDGSVSSDDIDIYIKFTKPEYNEAERRWETEIFICTEEGIKFSFGFTPQGKQYDHDVDDEFVEPTAEDLIQGEEPVIPTPVILTPEEQERKVKANSALFSALLKLTLKHEQLEKKQFRAEKKVSRKQQEQKYKDKELNRLKKIKKEITDNVKLFKSLKDKRRLNKALKELDEIMKKMKKLS